MTLFDQIEERSLKPLRDYQERSYAGMREAVRRRSRRPVLYMPTGAGKTFLTAHIVSNALKLGKRALFVVPILSLIGKTIQAFESQGITDIGVIQRQHKRTDYRCKVQIASMQTLIRRPQLMREFDIVVVDECHESYQELYAWMERDLKTVFIGLSATPWTRGMALHWSELIKGASIPELREKGAICPLDIYEPAHLPKRNKVKVKDGDFSDAQAAKEMSDRVLVADVYKMWVERGRLSKWFVFGQNCAHAKLLKESFEQEGVRCGYIDADTQQEERDSDNPDSDALFCQYRRGDIEVMFSVGCLGTGVDEDVRGISIAYLTKSRIKLKQDVGRGERIAEGKEVCIVNDHGGNFAELGMPEDFETYYDHLDMSDPAVKGDAAPQIKDPPKPKKCGKCRMLLPPKTSVCPRCGERPAVCNVETVDGSLVKREKKSPKAKKDENQIFYSGLLAIAAQRGFKPGWALAQYRAKFGVWPRGLVDMPARPTVAVNKFVNERRREYIAQKKVGNAVQE